MLLVFLVWICFAAICGSIGRYVGRPRGHTSDGYLFGFFLGPIGILIAALLTPTPEAEVDRTQQVERAREVVEQEHRGVRWRVVFDASRHKSYALLEVNRVRRAHGLPAVKKVVFGQTIASDLSRANAGSALDRLARFGTDAHVEAVEP